MSILHTKILPGEGWLAIAQRLCPPGVTLAQRSAFTNKMLLLNGYKLSDATVAGRLVHYDTDDFPVVSTPPRKPTTVPFSADSPFNKMIPSDAKWKSVPILNTLSTPEPNGNTNRYWYGGEGQLVVNRGIATDPIWLITMPEFGNTDTRFNRHWMPASWSMHLPETLAVGSNADSILSLVDEVSGVYAEIGNGTNFTIDTANHKITGTPGVWWARGNVDKDTGVGGLLSAGGNSAGIRAANFSWLAGAITGYDVDCILKGTKTDFGHALCVMLTQETMSTWGVTPPATAPNNAWNNGPINNGARIGIPANVSKPAGVGSTLLNNAFWNTLQRYGALVGDFAGGPWPIFQIDIGSVAKSALDSMWVWWEGDSANKYIVPELRVME